MELPAHERLSDDAAAASAVNVAQLSSVLLNRLREGLVYTTLGPTLISLNPGRVTAAPVSSPLSLHNSAPQRSGHPTGSNRRNTSSNSLSSFSWWRSGAVSEPRAEESLLQRAAQSGVPLFHASIMWQYFDGVQRKNGPAGRPGLPPHIFGMTGSAIRAALTERSPQSLLFQGERGSGKSEAHRNALRYIATVSRALKLRQAQMVAELIKSVPSSVLSIPSQVQGGYAAPDKQRAANKQLVPRSGTGQGNRSSANTPGGFMSSETFPQHFAAAAAATATAEPVSSHASARQGAGAGPAASVANLATSEHAVEQLLLDAHTVLDAFGSAGERASRSPASSRFMRWTALRFARDGSVDGVHIHAHLIDSTRVACPPTSVATDKWKPQQQLGSANDGLAAQRYVANLQHVRSGAGAEAQGHSRGSGLQHTEVSEGSVGGPAAVDTNFRIFYLLLAGCPSSERLPLRLRENPTDYVYLRVYGKTACPRLYKAPRQAHGQAAAAQTRPFPGAAALYVSGGGGANESYPLPPSAAEYMQRETVPAGAEGLQSDAKTPLSLSASVLADEWAVLQAALGRLQLGVGAQSALWRMLSAVLLLGEIQFASRDVPAPQSARGMQEGKPALMRSATVVANADLLWSAATLLGVPPERLATCLTTVPASARGANTALAHGADVGPTLPISPARACLVRDALACTLYRRLWSHLVSHINVVLSDAATVAVAARDQALSALMSMAQQCIASPKAERRRVQPTNSMADLTTQERQYVSKVTRALAALPSPSGAEDGASAILIVVDCPGLGGVVGDGLPTHTMHAATAASRFFTSFDREVSAPPTRGQHAHSDAVLKEKEAGPVHVSAFAGASSWNHLLNAFTAEALETLYQLHVFAMPAEQHSKEGVPHPYLAALHERSRAAAALYTARAPSPQPMPSPMPPNGGAVQSMTGVISAGALSKLDRPKALTPFSPVSGELSITSEVVSTPRVSPVRAPRVNLPAVTAAEVRRPVSPTRRAELPAIPFPDSRLVLALLSRAAGSEEILRRVSVGRHHAPGISADDILIGRPDAASKSALLTYVAEATAYAFPDPSTGLLGPLSVATTSSSGSDADSIGTVPSHWRVRDGQLDGDTVTSWLAQMQAQRSGAGAGVMAALRSHCTRLPIQDSAALLGVRFASSAGGPIGVGVGDGHSPILSSSQVQALAAPLFAIRHTHGWVAYTGDGMLALNACSAGYEESSRLPEGGRANGGLPEHLVRLMSTSSTDMLTSILMRGAGAHAEPDSGAGLSSVTIDPLTGEMINEPGSARGPHATPLGFADTVRPHACVSCSSCMVELTSSLLTILTGTKPHFVRCIRPCDDVSAPASPLDPLNTAAGNGKAAADTLSPPSVERQLRSMGGVQLGLLSAYGLPHAVPAEVFWERFVVLDMACLKAGGPTLPGWVHGASRFEPYDISSGVPVTARHATAAIDSAFAARSQSASQVPSEGLLQTGAVPLAALSRSAIARLLESLWARIFLPSEAKAATLVSAPLLRPETPLQAAVPRMFRESGPTACVDQAEGFGYAGMARLDTAFGIGRSSVFLSDAFFNCLENERERLHTIMDSATIRTQSWARARICRIRFIRLQRASLKTQTWWRCCRGQKKYKKLLGASETIKSFIMTKYQRGTFVRSINAALKWQRAWRRHVMPYRLKTISHRIRAMHELVRGYIIRQKMLRVYRAVFRMQRAVRAWLLRLGVKNQHKSAVLMVQSLFRGHRERKQNPVENSIMAKNRKARRRFLMLQKFVAHCKGARVRESFGMLRNAARSLQSWVRSRLTRKGFIRARAAVTILQAHARGEAARRSTMELRSAMTTAASARRLLRLRVAEAVGLGLVPDVSSRVPAPFLGPALSHSARAVLPDGASATSLRVIDVDVAAVGLENVYYERREVAAIAVRSKIVSVQPHGRSMLEKPVDDSDDGSDLLAELRHGLGVANAPSSTRQTGPSIAANASVTRDRSSAFVAPVAAPHPESISRTSWSAVFRSLCIALSARDATVASLATGEAHTVSACTHGRVYSWGWSDRGQLGHGTAMPSAEPRLLSCFSDQTHPAHPHAILPQEGTAQGAANRSVFTNPLLRGLGRAPIFIASVACGKEHSLALSNGGLVYTWGGNRRGQCGVGHTDSVAYPVVVAQGPHKPVVALAAGDAHSVLVTQMGAVYVCGAVESCGSGKLGKTNSRLLPSRSQKARAMLPANGNEADALFPSILHTLTHTVVKMVSTGRKHTVVIGADGDAYGWGANECGQLAQSSELLPIVWEPIAISSVMNVQDLKTVNRSGSPDSKVSDLDGVGRRRSGRGVTFTSAACGSYHTMLLTSSGRLWVAGGNEHGQLGLADRMDRCTLTPIPAIADYVQAQGELRVLSIAAAGHASFAIMTPASAFVQGPSVPLVRDTKVSRMRAQAASVADASQPPLRSATSERTVYVWGRAGVVTESKLRALLLRRVTNESSKGTSSPKGGKSPVSPAIQPAATSEPNIVAAAIAFASQGPASIAALSDREIHALAALFHIRAGSDNDDEGADGGEDMPVGNLPLELLVPTPVPRATSGQQGPSPLSISSSGQYGLNLAWVRTAQAQGGAAKGSKAHGQDAGTSIRPTSLMDTKRVVSLQPDLRRNSLASGASRAGRSPGPQASKTVSRKLVPGLTTHVSVEGGLVRRK